MLQVVVSALKAVKSALLGLEIHERKVGEIGCPNDSLTILIVYLLLSRSGVEPGTISSEPLVRSRSSSGSRRASRI